MRNLRAFFKHYSWLSAFVFTIVFTLVGFLSTKYFHTFLIFWLLIGFSVIYSLDKWFRDFTTKHKFWGKLYRLMLNCSILALLSLIIYSGILLFTKKFLDNQLIGSIVFVVEILLFIWLWKVISKNSWRWPSMKLTTFSIIVLFLIFAFAGIQPMTEYKDLAIVKITDTINTLKADAAKRSAEEKAKEIERLRNLGVNNPSATVEEVTKDKGLKLGLEVLEKVNSIRKVRGSPELQWDEKLFEYSIAHAKQMAAQKNLFHSSMYESFAENAWGGEGSQSWSAQTIVDSWMESDKHRTWLLCPNLKHVGVGIAYSDNGMYAAWTFWRNETIESDWWYQYTPDNPPKWWY